MKIETPSYVQLPYDREKPLGLSWQFCAWVAYPDQTQEKQRQDFFEALGALVYKAQGKHAPDPLRRFKRSKVFAVIKDQPHGLVPRGHERIARRQFALWVYLTSASKGLSIDAACKLATEHDPHSDCDMTIFPAVEFSRWSKGNARRSFYESLPALPMYLSMPVVSGVIRGALFDGLEGTDLPPRSILDAMFSDDWVWIACRYANRIADQLETRFPGTVFLRPCPEKV